MTGILQPDNTENHCTPRVGQCLCKSVDQSPCKSTPMSNMWKQATLALLLGLSVVTLFVVAACASVATPVPSNTPGMEATDQVSPRVGGTDMPTPTTGRKATSEKSGEVTDYASPKASGTDMPSPTAGPKATPERTGEIPATVNVSKDSSESIRRGDGAGGDDQARIPRSSGTSEDDQAPPIPDKRESKYPNLGSRLYELVASVEAGETTAEQAARGAAMHSGALVAVTIYLSGNVDEVIAFLEDNGGDPRNVGEDYIEAYVPVTLLGLASKQPGVLRVREIVPPERGQGG